MSGKSKAEVLTGSPQAPARENLALSLILREFQHRIANTLTVLHAGLRLELSAFTDPNLQMALRRHEKQIMAVAELHRFFAGGAGDAEIPAEDYFGPLCAILSRSILSPLGLQCEVFVGEGFLPAGQCELLGLIVAELVMNAAKHAFPGNIGGRVRIQLFARDMRWCCMVCDNGAGMQRKPRGIGSQLTDSLIDALGGKLAVHTGPDGTSVSIVFAG